MAQQRETALDRIGQVVGGGGAAAAEVLQQGRSMVQVRPNDYCTAMMVPMPRQEEEAIKRIEAECAADPKAMLFSWPVENRAEGTTSTVEGPTIKMAMCLAREWGNCAATAKLVEETMSSYLFEGVYVDLQTGFNCVRPYRMAKKNFSGKGKMQQDRAEDMVFEIGVSKATRNAVINGIPARVLQRGIRAVKAALGTKDLAGGAAVGLQRVLSAFAPLKLVQADLERKIGKPAAGWNKEDYGTLRVALDSITAGEATVDQLFPKAPKSQTSTKPAEEPKPKIQEEKETEQPLTTESGNPEEQEQPLPPEQPEADDDGGKGDEISDEEVNASAEERSSSSKGSHGRGGGGGGGRKGNRTLFGD
jgi:hypothetical protein